MRGNRADLDKLNCGDESSCSASDSGTVAEIEINGHLAYIPSELVPRLRELNVLNHRITQSPAGEIISERGKRSLLEPLPGGGTFRCPAGIVPYLAGLLGKEVQIINHPANAIFRLPEPRSSGRVGLDAVVRQGMSTPSTLFRLPHNGLLPDCIGAIAQAWPGNKVAVVCASSQEVRRLGKRLRRDRRVAIVEADAGSYHGERVVVGTPYGVLRSDVRFHEIGIVLFPEATDVFHRRVRCIFAVPDAHFRLFGFVTRETRLSPAEQTQLLAWYGCNTVEILSRDSVARPVRIGWIPSRRVSRRFRARTDDHARLVNDLIRTERQRQEHVVAMVHRLPELERLVAQNTHESTSSAPLAGPTRIVLAEDPLHALSLARSLPDWKVSAAPLCEWRHACLARGFAEAQLLDDGKVADRMILTYDTCTPRRLEDACTLFRVDGGAGLPNCLEGPVINNKLTQPLILLDLIDNHIPQLRERAAMRDRDYADKGWAQLEFSREVL